MSNQSVYPGTLDSFTDKEAKKDKVKAVDWNKIQDCIVSTQTELGTDPAGSADTVKKRLARSLADSGDLRSGTSFPVTEIGNGTPFYRTDLDTLYIYDGTTWDPVGGGANTVFSWVGIDNFDGFSTRGLPGMLQIASTSNNPAANSTNFGNFFACCLINTTTFQTLIPSFKWVKPSGINTLTLFIRVWAGSDFKYRLKADSLTVDSATIGAGTTPTDRAAISLDISSLTTGNTYDISVMGARDSGSGDEEFYVSQVIIIGS